MPVPTPASVKKTLDEKRASETTPQVVTISEKKTPKFEKNSRPEESTVRSSSAPTKGNSSKRTVRFPKKSVKKSDDSTSPATSENTARSRPKNKAESPKSTERRPLSNRPLLHNPALKALWAEMNKAVTDLGYEEVK